MPLLCTTQNVLAIAVLTATSAYAAEASHQCTFLTGAVVTTRFPCEQAMVNRFGDRLLELYPAVRQIDTSPDYIMGLYTFAMGSCSRRFAEMTPEQIGEGGAPFFPKEMGAAIATAGREVICPEFR